MGIDASDYDNDGDLDLYITDMVYTMYLLRNDRGDFKSRAHSAGVAINLGPDSGVGWGAAFFDFDNDGWQDLYVASTEYFQTFPELETTFMNPRADALFHNRWRGALSSISAAQQRHCRSATHPGCRLSPITTVMAISIWSPAIGIAATVSIRIRADEIVGFRWSCGGSGAVNRDAVGARVYLTTADGLTQMQTVADRQPGLGGNNQLPLHFGLGAASSANLRIVWSNGDECRLQNVPANQRLTLQYGVTAACG